MKNTIIYIFFSAAVLFTSCNVKEEPVKINDGKVAIIARMSESDVTKTIVDESTSHDYASGRTGLMWNSEDTIGVFGGTATNVQFSNGLDSNQTAGVASFTGNIGNEIPEFAYYPYSDEAGADLTKIPGEIPSVQVFDTDTRRIPSDYKIGGLSKTIKDGETITGYEFYFTNILSLFCVGVDATGTELASSSLQSVKLTFPETGALANGKFTINLKTRAISLTASTTPNIMSLNYSGSKNVLSEKVIGYMSCAPFSASGQNVTIEVTTSTRIVKFTTPLKTDFAPGFIYHFPITLKDWIGKEGVTVTPNEGGTPAN